MGTILTHGWVPVYEREDGRYPPGAVRWEEFRTTPPRGYEMLAMKNGWRWHLIEVSREVNRGKG